MAHVASSGPFSRFPGIDRTLAVLAGNGIRLSIAGRDAIDLDRDTPPFSFSGDDPVDAELADGAIDDLNVMTRRSSLRHRLSCVPAAQPIRLDSGSDLLLLTIRGAAVTAGIAGEHHSLAAGDTLVLDRNGDRALGIEPVAPAQLYVIELWRV
jgi:hypothetical protein